VSVAKKRRRVRTKPERREASLAKKAAERLKRMGEPARFPAGSVMVRIDDQIYDSAVTYNWCDRDGVLHDV